MFYTKISPFPINGGERIRSYGLLKVLSELGHTVIAVVSNQNSIDFNDYKLKNVSFIEFNNEPFTIIERITGIYYYRISKKLRIVLGKLAKQNEFDFAFLDYAFIGQYISFLKNKGIPVIYGTHNAESSLLLQEPVQGIFNKLRKIQFYWQAYWHERLYFPKADKLICVSEDDKSFYAKFMKPNKIHLIPNFLDESRYNANYEKEDYFVMTANFGAYMNKMGLKWIIGEVWNETLDKNHKLLLVGKGSKEAYYDLIGLHQYKNIISVGAVDDIVPYIAKAKAVFIPLLHGSGSRLKCLEAMALKTSIISTSKGVEGTVSDGFLVADTAEAFRGIVENFAVDHDRENILYNTFISNYSLEINKKRMQRLINELDI
ncbi:glycosyltransferase family 4 protein [Cytophaga sp. FL35]|uniref:glycosyltransferase family 4 protein n=1 Tax=Cytophaga sp. FL35 TaxID=1904456 RepID=UPI001653BC0E|nr:glycosyltransferase family 4 protein [Cytophaga sp. FL35]MBC6999403.1 glycosyltransferase family 4 protein [Cytophaga sp. FL35]